MHRDSYHNNSPSSLTPVRPCLSSPADPVTTHNDPHS
ncbi:hypothetical protein THAOC_26053, partial [Thalassiosira oceanica]